MSRESFTIQGITYLPVTTLAMRLDAEYWAQVRKAGLPTADPKALDVDVILSAQAHLLEMDGDVTVATRNVAHLARFVPAAHWRDIEPFEATDES